MEKVIIKAIKCWVKVMFLSFITSTLISYALTRICFELFNFNLEMNGLFGTSLIFAISVFSIWFFDRKLKDENASFVVYTLVCLPNLFSPLTLLLAVSSCLVSWVISYILKK